ncbi:GNAT family N-acetyltransferase [bacterium]|nr:GNAT family N-acetyltransferase [bacterium]
MLKIRLADIDDIEQIVALRMAFVREFQKAPESPDFVDLTRRYIADKLPKGEFMVWLAEEEGRVIGTGGLIFFIRPPLYTRPYERHPYILNMYTIPEWRGKGVATMLMKHIIDYVKTTPAKRISLHASEMGRSVYERLGFKPLDTEMVMDL